MTVADVLLILGLVLTGCLAAGGGLWVLAWLTGAATPASLTAAGEAGRIYLFRDQAILDATDQARRMLDGGASIGSDWQQLGGVLAPTGIDLDRVRDDALRHGTATQIAPDGRTRIRVEPQQDALRVTLEDLGQGEGSIKADRLSLAATEHELQTLRSLAQGVPWLVWRESPAGLDGDRVISWANAAYLELVERHLGADTSWPPPTLFDTGPLAEHLDETRRLALRGTARAAEDWYVCSAHRVGADIVFTAVHAAREVAAQAALGDLRQTLAQTLESLPTGLAVFDRHRVLTVANAAVIQLFDLPETFVASAPDLEGFLDHLRHSRRLPEPRDYRAWRRQVSRGEGDTGAPGYSATWTLPDGQILQVSAQVRGDNSLVLQFDDITLEMSLTRRFRAELDLSQAVLDQMDEALAVFNADGALGLSNASYDALWNSDPRVSLGDLNLRAAVRRWTEHCDPTPAWEELHRFGVDTRRRPWSAPLQHKAGGALHMRVKPLSGGAMLVGFRPDPGEVQTPGVLPARSITAVRALP